MELWIRSQDKKRLIKVESLTLTNTGRIVLGNDVNSEIILGKYSSYERALEVLNEIQKKINLINICRDIGSPVIDLNNPAYIYEMPPDDEDKEKENKGDE